MLRGVVVIGGILLVAGVIAELVAPGLVEDRIEETVRARTDDQARVDAYVAGSPFLPRLVLDGELERIEVTLEEVAGRQLVVGTVALSADRIELDRGALARGEVEITGIDTGRVTVLVDQEELSRALGVELDPGAMELAGRALEVAGRRALELPLEEVMPCQPDLDVDPPDIRLHCTFDEVPEVLRSGGD